MLLADRNDIHDLLAFILILGLKLGLHTDSN